MKSSNSINSFWGRINYLHKNQSGQICIGKIIGLLIFISYFTLLPKIFEFTLPSLMNLLPNKIIMGFGLMFLNLFITAIYGSIMYFIYKAKHPFFQQYRVNQKLWPWQENYDQWIQTLQKTIVNVSFNILIIGGIFPILDSWQSDYKYSIEDIPSTFTIIWQFLLFMLVEDFFFYVGHSILHKPSFYWIHKKHHEYKNVISIASQYAHPLEQILGNSMPTFIGYKVLSNIYPVHCISIWVFLTFRFIESNNQHSGYEWDWQPAKILPFSSGASHHNFHHSHNSGNYGALFHFWDSVFGTNVPYLQYLQKNENKKDSSKFSYCIGKNQNPQKKSQ